MPCLKLQRQNTDLKVLLDVLIPEPYFLKTMQKLKLLFQKLMERLKESRGQSASIFFAEELDETEKEVNQMMKDLKQTLRVMENDNEELKHHVNEAKILLKKAEEQIKAPRFKYLDEDDEPDCDAPAIARR